MTWLTEHDFVDGKVMAARYHNDFADDLDYLKGEQEGQTLIELEADLQVAEDIGAQETEERFRLEWIPLSFAGALRFAGYHASALSSGDAVTLLFSLRNPSSGAVEDLARIQLKKSASIAGRGQVVLNVANAGAFLGSPSLTLFHTRRLGILDGSSSSYAVNLAGDCNADGYEGLTAWGESPAGTAYHQGDAQITGQWISTVSAPTAPLKCSAGSALCKNLNADLLAGLSWHGAPLTNTGSTTVTTKEVEYTICSVTTASAGLYLILAEVTVTVDTNDAAARFFAKATGAPVWSTRSDSVATGQINISSFGFYQATSSETLSWIAQKGGGTGSSAAAGSILAMKVGS